MPYQGVDVWSGEEVMAYLDLLKRDGSALGSRDYAFFLVRLHSGAPLKLLLELRWGQLEAARDHLTIGWKEGIQRKRATTVYEQYTLTWRRVAG
jgi:hypothetical protein